MVCPGLFVPGAWRVSHGRPDLSSYDVAPGDPTSGGAPPGCRFAGLLVHRMQGLAFEWASWPDRASVGSPGVAQACRSAAHSVRSRAGAQTPGAQARLEGTITTPRSRLMGSRGATARVCRSRSAGCSSAASERVHSGIRGCLHIFRAFAQTEHGFVHGVNDESLTITELARSPCVARFARRVTGQGRPRQDDQAPGRNRAVLRGCAWMVAPGGCCSSGVRLRGRCLGGGRMLSCPSSPSVQHEPRHDRRRAQGRVEVDPEPA